MTDPRVEHLARAAEAARAAATLRESGDPSVADAALTLEALASLEARDAQQACPDCHGEREVPVGDTVSGVGMETCPTCRGSGDAPPRPIDTGH